MIELPCALIAANATKAKMKVPNVGMFFLIVVYPLESLEEDLGCRYLTATANICEVWDT